MKNEKRLSDVTREASTSKANKFANSLMPAAPKPRPEIAKETPVEPATGVESSPPTDGLVPTVEAPPIPATQKPERLRKSGGLSVDDVLNMPVKDGEVFNKMVRLTDNHHELLRLIAFNSRKPMNVIVHNLIALLEQAYQKEQKGDTSNV